MNSQVNVSSFPLGVDWSFSPSSSLLVSGPEMGPLSTAALDVWSLPLEPLMVYGGRLQSLLKSLSERYQLVFRSQYPHYLEKWNEVHRQTFERLLGELNPAYIVFENLPIGRAQLIDFEREIFKLTDVASVLPVPIKVENNQLLYDELFVRDLLTRTRLQLSLSLSQICQKINLQNVSLLVPQLEKFFALIFEKPLRVAEIKLSPTLGADSKQFEVWRNLLFDHDVSSTIIWEWDEALVSTEWLGHWLKASFTVRGNRLDPLNTVAPLLEESRSPRFETQLSKFERAFRAVYIEFCKNLETSSTPRGTANFVSELIREYSRWLKKNNFVELEVHEEMRAFPLFLQSYRSLESLNDSSAALAQLDWARFAAEFHPADETIEQMFLEKNEIKVNPTVQTFTGVASLRIFCRRQHLQENESFFERDIQWNEAAVLDHIKENFKIHTPKLLESLNGVLSPHQEKPTAQFWQETIKVLVADGIILIGLK
jgi:hypothetical protein